MPAQLLPDTWRMVVTSVCQGEVGINVFHLDAPNVPLQGTNFENSLADTFNDFQLFYQALAGMRWDGSKVVSFKCSDISTPNGFQREQSVSINGSGDKPLPLHDSLAITWRTAVSGRRTRGRTYIPFISANAIDQDTALFNQSTLDVAFSAASGLINNLGQGPGVEQAVPLVVASFTGQSKQHVTAAEIGRRPDVQLRRRNKLSEGPYKGQFT